MRVFNVGSIVFASLLVVSSTASEQGTQYNSRRVLKKSKKSKRAKSSKNGKRSSVDELVPTSLSAFITKAPRYEGNLNPFGTSVVRCNEDGSFLFHISATGLDSSCTHCKIAIMDATSCSSDFSSSFYTSDLESDPWNANGENYYFTFTDSGISRSAFTFTNGYECNENLGKVVAIYDASEEMIGCGKLGLPVDTNVLQANIGAYPGYEGDLSPVGTVTLTFFADDTFSFDYNVKGLRENVKGAGIHIHAGVSCDSHEEVLGHGWNTEVLRDLWTLAGGAIYSTNTKGTADGMFHLYNGFKIEENVHHALVIHDFDGTRVGCGVLMYD